MASTLRITERKSKHPPLLFPLTCNLLVSASLGGNCILTHCSARPDPYVATPEGKAFAHRLWDELVAQGKKLDSRVGKGLKQ